MGSLKGRDLLKLSDLSPDEVMELLEIAAQLKSGKLNPRITVNGHPPVLGLLFYKASTRTRVSFSTAMYHLGGQVLDLPLNATQVSRGEPIEDTARVLDRYLDILAIRTFEQSDLDTFAQEMQIPVINALTDLEHPCQVLADLQTIQETFSTLSGLTLTYVGDGNNVAHSLMLGCALVGMNVRIATPIDYRPLPEIVQLTEKIANGKSEVLLTDDPIAAAKDSHVLYTDVWASMGQEDLAESRIPIFQPYQVNSELMSYADKDAIVLHCLPAHRGEEITEDVIEGSQSKVWDQAENRMHAQKALMASLLGAV
ncbi:ornithine carbamoyltransferase [Leptolyngbya boryana NIES-2135]|jgi:ornithine carbamoyltransferase|uniref:Ornithine carbamoyltransferase n=1 Tax=Leptolyngbya boryana NIES-2135 TaxID=1973484 RepID=A0A1Z4JN33_LEPBY|nr:MULTISPECIES: ornithine carbamoyltransferase [Leptolyngbya]BAY58116.1 ornithine carbamoyltransferase [Leptolyngbya boryana NIES-2135]MBD2369101.1 ornithine carbamoyltransferase [Leptolyngbya sp. FACHB-161]MBD2375552.1 ornithine carbamoyltransferase [Leptolyngbya sp. FACHB-238]MBD2400126.1 ornithine carbamoyltransferase [Leptolyngbya sp. FACHB-239]MBD2406486.1 ornithine carbamoyltransferase [Leptolyngbya sp. FACHB-402]